MTVTGHRIKRGSPTGGAGTGARNYKATLWVESDDCKDTGHAILEYVITQGFDYGTKWAFGNDTNDKLRLFQISPPKYVEGSAYIWEVDLHYKEFKLSVAVTTVKVDPTDFLPEITTRTVARVDTIEKAIYRDGLRTNWTKDEERTITNSANTPFVPTLEAEFFNKSVRVVRRTVAVIDNETNFPTFWINDRDFDLSNGFITLNVKQFELRFTGWEHTREQYEGYDLVRVEFTGEIKKGGWREELLDHGVMVDNCPIDDPNHPDYDKRQDGRGSDFVGLDDPPNQSPQRMLLDRSGNPISRPALLDGLGNALPVCSKQRYYGLWSFYDEIDPTALGFFAGITSIPSP